MYILRISFLTFSLLSLSLLVERRAKTLALTNQDSVLESDTFVYNDVDIDNNSTLNVICGDVIFSFTAAG